MVKTEHILRLCQEIQELVDLIEYHKAMATLFNSPALQLQMESLEQKQKELCEEFDLWQHDSELST